MINTSDISLKYGSRALFENVNVKFTPGNCYGLIGANGAGKSTFLKILASDIEPSLGSVYIPKDKRLSILRQDHYKFDDFTVLDTVLKGNDNLYKIMQEKDELYSKGEFSEADGIRAAELEELFAEMNGWEAEADASVLLAGLAITEKYHAKKMHELNGGEKVKILLAQALFGNPDILLLDEPTNHLDIAAVKWLEDFLLNFTNTVILVSHDRHFMNKVCTHIADIDFAKITTYTGNYEFWKKSSELAMRLRSDQLKKNKDKSEDLKAFISRFSANAAKSKQATARRKQLDSLNLDDLPVSTRKNPFINFVPKREVGNQILKVDNISMVVDGKEILKNISFEILKGDKIGFVSDNDLSLTILFQILSGELTPTSGSYTYGSTITTSFFPSDNSKYFENNANTLIDWLRDYSEDEHEEFLRGYLGKMLFSREEALKDPKVLSGGEKVRCMLAKMMLSGANFLCFDDPTSHLDLESIGAVDEGLQRFTGSVIFKTHDHQLLQNVANRIIKIETKIKQDQSVTYDEFLESN